MNCIIGASYVERLSRPFHIHLFQRYLKGWLNLGIGGDKAEHIRWRVENGCIPYSLQRVIICSGSNNTSNNTNSKTASMIAGTVLETVSYINSKFPNARIAVLGILPRENCLKSNAIRLINNVIKFRLPSTVDYIPPPSTLDDASEGINCMYYRGDRVHLNNQGYELVFSAIEAYSNLLSPPMSPSPSAPMDDWEEVVIGKFECISTPSHPPSHMPASLPPPGDGFPPLPPSPPLTLRVPLSPVTSPWGRVSVPSISSISAFPPLPPPLPSQPRHVPPRVLPPRALPPRVPLQGVPLQRVPPLGVLPPR